MENNWFQEREFPLSFTLLSHPLSAAGTEQTPQFVGSSSITVIALKTQRVAALISGI